MIRILKLDPQLSSAEGPVRPKNMQLDRRISDASAFQQAAAAPSADKKRKSVGPINCKPSEMEVLEKVPDTTLICHMDGLFAYAMVLTRNPAEAADLVQETYVRALRAKGSLRSGSKVKSWLFTILRNIWLNQLRHQRVAPVIAELEDDQSIADIAIEISQDPHQVYVSKVEREQVRQAIQQLPTEFREIIILREFEELPYQDIADILKCRPGTVMSRLARARSKLRTLLSAKWQHPHTKQDQSVAD